MEVPYSKRLSESIKKACSKHWVQVYFKECMTIKNLLMVPKDKDSILKRVESYMDTKCDRVECDEVYIGESSRIFG